MAAVPTTLQAALEAIYAEAKAAPMTEAVFAQKMSIAIDTYIRTFVVATVVTGTLPAGPVAAVGAGGLS